MPQCKPDMRIVKIIRRADTDIINLCTASFKLVKMPVETFKLNEKITLRKIIVNKPHTVKPVETGKQVVPCILNGFKMTNGYVACYAYQAEIFGSCIHLWFFGAQIY